MSTDNVPTELRGSSERRPTAVLLRWARWRVLAALVVFGIGLLAFQGGVEISERPDLGSAGLLTRLYYTVGLFFLGGLDIGVPSGGPDWAVALAWFAWFAAPGVTASALVEAASRILAPHAVRRGLRHHVIIGGCGRLSMLYLRALRARDRRVPVIIIERQMDNPYLQVATETHHARVIHGDLYSHTLMRSLHIDRAHRVALFTGDDHLNLDASVRALRINPALRGQVIAHVSDLGLLRIIEANGLTDDLLAFNSYRTAAHHLVESLLVPHFRRTELLDTVVLAGFGRFGQTVLDELQKEGSGLFRHVVIVDAEADRLVANFSQQVGFKDDYEYTSVRQGIHEPAAWDRVSELVTGADERLVQVLGTGDESLNLRTAMQVARRAPQSAVVARTFHRSEFTDSMARQGGFHVVSTAELLLKRFEREGWLDQDALGDA